VIPPNARVPLLHDRPDVASEEWVRYLTVTLPAALAALEAALAALDARVAALE
jgi:hypothetical protein